MPLKNPSSHASHLLLLSIIVLSLLTESRSQSTVDTHTSDDADLTLVTDWMTQHTNDTMRRLYEFLKIPSVSADPKRASEVRRAADWLVSDLQDAGLEHVQLLASARHPAVYADWLHASDAAPTVLLYAHYDVQPEDPVSSWTTPPFSPTVRGGRLYARGASDDKGHLYVVATALRAFLATTRHLPVNVKVFFEGEEEIGSPNLAHILRTHAHLLKADVAFSADGNQLSEKLPGLCLGLRGMVGLEVSVRTANEDLHSGSFGGGVQNPLHALVRLLDGLRDPKTGKIAVDSFYDDVYSLSQAERDDIAQFPVPASEELEAHGINETVGEHGFSFHERTWARPSLEIVGIKGGFQGDGIKTVLPFEASAKLSSRIVPDQSAEKTVALVRAHILKSAASIPGVEVTVEHFKGSAEPFRSSKTSLGNVVAAKVLQKLYGRPPVYFRLGGSIPAFMTLHKMLSVDTTMFAFALATENWHAPNEYTLVSSLRRAEQAYAMLLSQLAKEARPTGNQAKTEDAHDEL